jgi:hypothetical protein
LYDRLKKGKTYGKKDCICIDTRNCKRKSELIHEELILGKGPVDTYPNGLLNP